MKVIGGEKGGEMSVILRSREGQDRGGHQLFPKVSNSKGLFINEIVRGGEK